MDNARCYNRFELIFFPLLIRFMLGLCIYLSITMKYLFFDLMQYTVQNVKFSKTSKFFMVFTAGAFHLKTLHRLNFCVNF